MPDLIPAEALSIGRLAAGSVSAMIVGLIDQPNITGSRPSALNGWRLTRTAFRTGGPRPTGTGAVAAAPVARPSREHGPSTRHRDQQGAELGHVMADPDLYTRLRNAIEERLALAQAATQGTWTVGVGEIRAEAGCRGRVLATIGAYTCTWPTLPDMVHIAANGPDAVIRACRADLARLQRHAPEQGRSRRASETPGCVGCGSLALPEGGFDWRYLWPCPEVRSLAEVWLEAE